MKKGSFFGLGCVLLYATFMIGCGGSGDATTMSVTKAAFIKRGNAICQKAEEEKAAADTAVTENYKPGTKLTTLERAELLVGAALPSIKKATTQLDDLDVPEGQEPHVEAIITAFEEGAKAAEANPVAAASGAAFKKAWKLAEDYGLTKCAA